MSLRAIPSILMRGGTSRGPLIFVSQINGRNGIISPSNTPVSGTERDRDRFAFG
jgi:2-methylaconitate cis-trans-isomerase PrpF